MGVRRPPESVVARYRHSCGDPRLAQSWSRETQRAPEFGLGFLHRPRRVKATRQKNVIASCHNLQIRSDSWAISRNNSPSVPHDADERWKNREGRARPERVSENCCTHAKPRHKEIKTWVTRGSRVRTPRRRPHCHPGGVGVVERAGDVERDEPHRVGGRARPPACWCSPPRFVRAAVRLGGRHLAVASASRWDVDAGGG